MHRWTTLISFSSSLEFSAKDSGGADRNGTCRLQSTLQLGRHVVPCGENPSHERTPKRNAVFVDIMMMRRKQRGPSDRDAICCCFLLKKQMKCDVRTDWVE
mmetsp:Transcript_15281/g.22541  ORF Transcript_15281/g.22541 Transcript_15281/m.22541 type:complete len:101 (+) Transcript_15281:1692-1994(+)